MGGVDRAIPKGLDIAFAIAKATGIELRVAGSTKNPHKMEAFKALCEKNKAIFMGAVYGERKAELFAGAKALLFPSRYNEACPLVIAEALMSGTPVIASDCGANPELIDEKIGFICSNLSAYIRAINQVGKIDPAKCRERAMDKFHYHVMAKGYVQEYKKEIEKYKLALANRC